MGRPATGWSGNESAPALTRRDLVPESRSHTRARAGVRQPSFIKCEDVRSVSRSRLRERWGAVAMQTMASVEDRLRILMGL
jgi:mRNA interferase MazF